MKMIFDHFVTLGLRICRHSLLKLYCVVAIQYFNGTVVPTGEEPEPFLSAPHLLVFNTPCFIGLSYSDPDQNRDFHRQRFRPSLQPDCTILAFGKMKPHKLFHSITRFLEPEFLTLLWFNLWWSLVDHVKIKNRPGFLFDHFYGSGV